MGVENWKDNISNFWNSQSGGYVLGIQSPGFKAHVFQDSAWPLGKPFLLLTCKVRVVSSQLLPELQRAVRVN